MKEFIEFLKNIIEYLKFKIKNIKGKGKSEDLSGKSEDLPEPVNYYDRAKNKYIKNDTLYRERIKIEWEKEIRPVKSKKLFLIIIIILLVFSILYFSTDSNEEVLHRLQSIFTVIGM